ncbi:ATP-dependent DNA ligase [Microbacterium dextranolyticum]|uniref:DNA ligase (ATP) n=1 Tax=Microbacterium dextranolyticum TaxID=36806 RepID=A0A9W6M6A0_9MICO|nr:ATP-dependent DNA ligase [Microbacterium dextranolyticum]MBM7463238.1 bifunctional non-homologous end joining protein LigD [Microbacterium dextranolyticum]GLJ95656.1 ATP-dependent DNA ligase [Microbacterium dextranolyticum]
MPASGPLVEVDGHRLRLTNLDKVLYPATGTTKGEVIEYYTLIAPFLLPHLRGRPVTRLRWPEGTGHAPFFAKALEAGAPAWLDRRAIEHSGGAKQYPVIGDTAGLVYLAQVASIELHTPQWRFDGTARGHPDRLVLDLDPGPGVGLAECAEVARLARELLRGVGMDARPVTSGSAGIHLYAPLDGTHTSDDISAFAHELARSLEADHADLVVSTMAKSARTGKVLVDWSQNNAAKTTVAPYSLRGRASPTAAAPRTWAELDDPALRQLTLDEVLARARADGDLLEALAPRPAQALRAYETKRTRGATPEPFPADPDAARPAPTARVDDAGGSASTPTGRFVVQEHHASRLHDDLRLEHDGVLVSWAVPRGIPPTGERNHLAIMTEPHPLEYLDFAGTIPAGQYGAGEMTIWDAGVYDAEKWRDDEVIVTVTGRSGGPLGTARLALIRTSGSGERSQWLLHRMDPGDGARALSAMTQRRRTPAEVAAPPQTSWTTVRPMLATLATPAIAASAAARWGTPWAEFKWDGIRALGRWDGTRLTLQARSGTDITARYPELTAIDLGLGPEPVIVDGEIVATDAAGRPSFSRLQSRIHLTEPHEIDREARRTPVTYLLFDVLQAGGADVTARPLRDRRALLEVLHPAPSAPIIVPPVTDDVTAALDAARERTIEGIVVKDPGSPYRPGTRSERWLKVKLTSSQDVVVGGIRPGRGTRAGRIGSLLVGIPDADGLRYVGRVGSGFTERELDRLDALLTPLRSVRNPFIGVPRADRSDAVWLRPEVVGEVEYAEFTPNGTLRHARWRGSRGDVTPSEVRRDG